MGSNRVLKRGIRHKSLRKIISTRKKLLWVGVGRDLKRKTTNVYHKVNTSFRNLYEFITFLNKTNPNNNGKLKNQTLRGGI